MAVAKTFTVRLRIDGVTETLKALNQLEPDANKAIRAHSLELSRQLAGRIKAKASASGRQAALLAPTVKAGRDRVPLVRVGGTSPRIGRPYPRRGRARPFELLFGSEFGGDHGHGFLPHRGRKGYWINPTVEAAAPLISREWNAAADEVVRQFGTRAG